MKKKRDDILVGLVLLVAVVSTLLGTIWIARGGLARNYYVTTRFPWGAGLKQGQQVLLAGVQIGFVDDVALDPSGTILVTLKIKQQYRIPKGSVATIEPYGIFGDQLIAIRPVLGVKDFLSPGDSVPTTKGAPGTADLISKGDSIASDLRALSGRTRAEFVEGGGMRDIRQTVTALTKLVAQISAVTAEQSRQLTRTQETLRKAVSAVDSVKVDSTLRNLRATSASLDQLAREVRTTNSQVQGVLTKVSSGNGSAARLLNDPSLYARLDTLLARVDSLTADFKKNPRKYINLKIF